MQQWPLTERVQSAAGNFSFQQRQIPCSTLVACGVICKYRYSRTYLLCDGW